MTARTRPPRYASEAQQTRVNVDALEQRVYGTERKIDDLSAQTFAQINSLRQDLVTSIGAISTKLDVQQRDVIAAGRIPLLPLIGTAIAAVVAVVSIFTVIGGMALGPVLRDIEEGKRSVRDINVAMTPLLAFAAQHDRDIQRFLGIEDEIKDLDKIKWSKDAQAEFERRIDEKFLDDRADVRRQFDVALADINAIRSDLVSRSEHQTHWTEFTARLDALSVRINDVQKEFGSNFTLGDAVKELQRRVSELTVSAPVSPAH